MGSIALRDSGNNAKRLRRMIERRDKEKEEEAEEKEGAGETEESRQ